MSVEFLWRIPVHGDGRRAHKLHTRGEWNQLTPAVQSPQRVAPQHEDQLFAYYDYVEQVAKAADIVGFHGSLIPAYASQMAASLQRLSQGRVEWNVISGEVAHSNAHMETSLNMINAMHGLTNS